MLTVRARCVLVYSGIRARNPNVAASLMQPRLRRPHPLAPSGLPTIIPYHGLPHIRHLDLVDSVGTHSTAQSTTLLYRYGDF